MKSLRHLLACAALLSLSLMGCERHDFESTKVLHLEHGGGHHEGEHAGEKHDGDHKDEAGKSGHGEGEHKEEAHKDEGKKPEEAAKGEPRETGI